MSLQLQCIVQSELQATVQAELV